MYQSREELWDELDQGLIFLRLAHRYCMHSWVLWSLVRETTHLPMYPLSCERNQRQHSSFNLDWRCHILTYSMVLYSGSCSVSRTVVEFIMLLVKKSLTSALPTFASCCRSCACFQLPVQTWILMFGGDNCEHVVPSIFPLARKVYSHTIVDIGHKSIFYN